MYLEISGRGTGKSYRLAQAALQYLSQDSRNIVNIVCPTQRQAECVKKQALQISKNPEVADRIRCIKFEREDPAVRGFANVRNFYDEFDFIDFKLQKNDPFFFGDAFQNDYYVTSPARIRDLSKTTIQELAKTDFLIRLLAENKGMHVSFHAWWMWGERNSFNILKEAMIKESGQEAFETEIEGRFIKY